MLPQRLGLRFFAAADLGLWHAVGIILRLKQGYDMAPPLTRRKKNGELYTRTPSVQAAIDRASTLDFESLIREARIQGPGKAGYMEPECLLHLLRWTRMDNSDARFRNLFEAFFERVECSLKGSVRDIGLYDPHEIRSAIVDKLVDIIVEDRNSPGTKLDFFEAKFAKALAALRIDVLRKSQREAERTDHVEEMSGDDGEDLPSLTSQIRLAFAEKGSEQEKEHFRNELLRAIDRLPAHEREAVMLVLEGHHIEGADEETIAKLCGVSDRMVRYRLTKAYERLRRELGERR